MGKPQKVTIGGEEFEMKPLTVKDLPLITSLSDEKKRAEATKELIHKVLKQMCPDATEEEINNFGLQHLDELMNAIMTVNNLKMPDMANKK